MSEPNQTQVNNPTDSIEEFTLEQILSEYKSEAFMRNERKLPKQELEKQAERIIAEMRRELDGQATASEPPAVQESPEREAPPSAPAQETPAEIMSEQKWERVASEELPQPEPTPKPEAEPLPDPVELEAERIRLREEEAAAAAALEAERAEKRAEEERLRAERARVREEQRRLREEEREAQRRRHAEEKEEQRRRRQEEKNAREAARQKAQQEWLQKMADLGPVEAGEKYASGVRSLQRRTMVAFVLCALMALITLVGRGNSPQFVFLHGRAAVCTALLVLQLAVMICGWDILVKGIMSLAGARPGSETLVTFASLAAVGDALWLIRGADQQAGLPYSAAAALTLAFALLGTRMGKTALRDSFRTMRGARVPTAVQLEPELTDLGPVISKHLGGYRGFIARMLQQDPVEDLYRKLTLLLIVLCIVLALLTGLIAGDGAWLHALAGLGVSAASCTALLAYRRTFALVARRLAGRGAAIAGWSGAEELAGGQGIILRDGDLFPEKNISVTGMKVLSGTRVEQVISYTGSMILTSGSGLGRTFGELMRQYAAPTRRTDNFQYDADGGFSAVIAQDQVYVGTGAYMSLKGIRIPANIDVSGAIYTAVNGKLCALFIVEHTPSDGVRSALLSLRGGRLRPVFAIRDFNITPAMLKSKFRLAGSELSFPPAEDRFRLSAEVDPEEQEPPAAILTRDGLGHYLEAVRAGRRMIKAVRRSIVLTLLGSFIAMAIIALGIARGAYVSISAWNMLVFQLGWTAATLLLSDNADGN